MAADPTSSSNSHRTWPHRLLIAALCLGAVGSFTSAAGALFVQRQLEERVLVQLDSPVQPATQSVSEPTATSPEPTGSSPGQDPVETFPQAETGARNILITGADNNACLDPDSPYAPAFGDRQSLGERSDTIMMWRVNPETSQVAVLSFPRDLWVDIAGNSGKSRINSAYERDNPQRLIDTIQENFGLQTDNFIQIDFCAFKAIVDAVGGVAVPFESGVRDPNTGLNVPETQTGCYTFEGEHALAYVRSRKLEYFDTASQTWKRDGTSDLGRISRQQDFIRRVGDQLLANAFSPSVVRSLLDISRDYIVTDAGLTPDKILELSGVLSATNPADITTYQIEAVDRTIQGNAVLEPRLGGDNMQNILALFRGGVTLSDRPGQDGEPESADQPTTDATSTNVPNTTVPVIDPNAEPASIDEEEEEEVTAESTAPDEGSSGVDTEDIVFGVTPDPDTTCG